MRTSASRDGIQHAHLSMGKIAVLRSLTPSNGASPLRVETSGLLCISGRRQVAYAFLSPFRRHRLTPTTTMNAIVAIAHTYDANCRATPAKKSA